MPDQFFYTALIHAETKAIEFAEHFAAEVDRDERAKQLESEVRCRGESSGWRYYKGEEPPESYIARMSATMGENEDPEKFIERLDKLAAKAAEKTKSVLTEPAYDDSQERRPVPAIIKAREDYEAAKVSFDELTTKAEKFKIWAETKVMKVHSAISDTKINKAKADELRAEAEAAMNQSDRAKAEAYKAETYLGQKRERLEWLEAGNVDPPDDDAFFIDEDDEDYNA